MDIKQLKYFVAVVDRNSFSQAGKHLFVSQSTLSKAIDNLEQELGVQLLYFSGKKMHATPQGTQLYHMAQNMINQHNMILERMQGASPAERGVIKIGISHITGPCVFPRLAASFLEQYPSIECLVEQHQAPTVQEMVEKNLLDVGFVLLPSLSDNLEALPLQKSQYVVITSTNHPLARRKMLRFADLRNERFITLSQEYRSYHELLAGCRMADFEPRIVMRLSHWNMIFQLVKLDMGISLLPLPLLECFPDEKLTFIRLSDAIADWESVMITLKNQYETPALRLFKNHIRARVKG